MQICEICHYTILTKILLILMCIQNLVKFCPLVLKILSGNEILTSIKGHNTLVQICEICRYTIPTKILLILMCIQNLVKFCPLVLKILSGNEILTSIKGHNSVANLQKMTLYNPNLDLVNAYVYTNFG